MLNSALWTSKHTLSQPTNVVRLKRAEFSETGISSIRKARKIFNPAVTSRERINFMCSTTRVTLTHIYFMWIYSQQHKRSSVRWCFCRMDVLEGNLIRLSLFEMGRNFTSRRRTMSPDVTYDIRLHHRAIKESRRKWEAAACIRILHEENFAASTELAVAVAMCWENLRRPETPDGKHMHACNRRLYRKSTSKGTVLPQISLIPCTRWSRVP